MALYKAGIKPKLIAEKLGVYLSLVYRVVGKESAVSDYARKFGSGRKKLLNEVELDILKRKIEVNNRLSGPKLANTIKNETGKNVSRWTVLRSLAIDGFHSRSTAKKPLFSDKNIKDRYSWVSKLIY
ncbi:hypothetical protein CDIK_2312 [Cucumispora dikerogammari]|nr:hypothetical protein CDIK_2312 [Cucumispora dikerogammari]